MATYTVCVELHGRPSALEIELVKEKMAKLGLSQKLEAISQTMGPPVTIELPYLVFLGNFDSDSLTTAVLVRTAAGQIRSVARVYVAATTEWSIV